MKRFIVLLSVLAFFAVSAAAQDFVTKRNGEDIAAIVDEVGPDYVKFRLWNEPDGVVYSMRKSDILMVRYATGRNEVFEHELPTIAVSPTMNYRQMSDYYDYRLYQRSIYDKYSPVGSGIASLFIPGLGQMICGEWGRGFAWLGGSFGGVVLMLTTALAESEELFLMSAAATLAVRVGSIVDGTRVAKVKNMYLNDLRAAGYYGFELDMYPSVNYVRTASGIQPTAGMTLALRF